MSYCNHQHCAQFDDMPPATVAAIAAAEPETPPVCDLYATQRRNRLRDDLDSLERYHRLNLRLSYREQQAQIRPIAIDIGHWNTVLTSIC